MSDKIRTALFGGTFNPFHNGHLAIARSVIEHGLADELWLLVTPCNPWKEGRKLLDNDLRLEMVSQAVSGIPGVSASDYEFSLPVPSYTANTLRHIKSDYPEREFILTIGADNWVEFDKWRDWQYILENFKIIVYPRTGCRIGQLPEDVTLLDCPLVDTSSTEIVARIRKGLPIDTLVPASVARTISELGLYR